MPPLYDKSPLPEQNWTGATCDSLRGVFELVDNLHESLGHGKHGYTKPPVGKERNRRGVVWGARKMKVCVWEPSPRSPSLSCRRTLGSGLTGVCVWAECRNGLQSPIDGCACPPCVAPCPHALRTLRTMGLRPSVQSQIRVISYLPPCTNYGVLTTINQPALQHFFMKPTSPFPRAGVAQASEPREFALGCARWATSDNVFLILLRWRKALPQSLDELLYVLHRRTVSGATHVVPVLL